MKFDLHFCKPEDISKNDEILVLGYPSYNGSEMYEMGGRVYGTRTTGSVEELIFLNSIDETFYFSGCPIVRKDDRNEILGIFIGQYENYANFGIFINSYTSGWISQRIEDHEDIINFGGNKTIGFGIPLILDQIKIQGVNNAELALPVDPSGKKANIIEGTPSKIPSSKGPKDKYDEAEEELKGGGQQADYNLAREVFSNLDLCEVPPPEMTQEIFEHFHLKFNKGAYTKYYQMLLEDPDEIFKLK
jgi:hypothetical protein